MAGILQEAIQLIKQGKKHEAREMLEGLLRSDPKEVANWFWYAETLETPEQRAKVLELCLKANPGNPQAEKALDILRAKLAPPAPPPVESKPAFDWDALENAPVESAQEQAEIASDFSWDDQPKRTSRAAAWDEAVSQEDAPGGIVWDDDEPETGTGSGIDWDSIEQAQAQKESPPVFMDDKQAALRANPPSFPFYEAWFTALTTRDVREYKILLLDPEAGQVRAYEWVAYVGLLSGLLLPLLSLNEFNLLAGELFPSVAPTPLMILVFTASAILSCISAVLGLIFSGAIQFLLAKFMGGLGTFSKTIYAISAYLAPLTIVSTIIGIIPLVNCLSPLIAIYGIVLNVRALQAAHDMNTSRAVIVVLLPAFLFLMVFCLIGMIFLPALTAIFENMPLP
jgi:hypothetical protein